MVEDKLTTDQRIRLEALAQSVATNPMHAETHHSTIERARYYEQYIKNGAFENAEA